MRRSLLVQHRGACLAGHQCLYPSRGQLHSHTRVSGHHKDIQEVILSADAIKERIKVMGRCAQQPAAEHLLHQQNTGISAAM